MKGRVLGERDLMNQPWWRLRFSGDPAGGPGSR